MPPAAGFATRWPAWIRFGLVGAIPIFVITGSRMAWAVATGHSADGAEAAVVLAKGTLAGFGGGVAYALLGRPLARFGRVGSTLAGAIAIFAFLVGCSFAFPLGRVDRFVIGFGVALSLVGGWILNPAGIEREVLATRVRRLGWFCRSGEFDPRTVGAERLEEALRRFRAEMLELEHEDDGEPVEDPLEALRREIEWLRAAPARTRELAAQGLFDRPLRADEVERLLADIESASRRADA